MDENKYEEKKGAVETNYHPGSDAETSSVKDALAYGDGKLVRQLKNRHVAMIRYAICVGFSNYSKLTHALVSVVLSELVSIPLKTGARKFLDNISRIVLGYCQCSA
jgi:hypothetical protein